MKRLFGRKILKYALIGSAIFMTIALVANVGTDITESCDGKKPIADHPNIEVFDSYEKDHGYYVFMPKDDSKLSGNIVGLVHGYGALNPMIFGNWIEHLVHSGHIVVYPRYQWNLLSPSADEFTENTGLALKAALQDIEEAMGKQERRLFLVGHSFGGVISANLLAQYEEYDLPKPSGVLVAEGGTGPLASVQLEDYGAMDPSVPLIVVVGENDYTVSDYFGKRLLSEARSDLLVYIEQRSMSALGITSSHYEPYSPNEWCDNGIENLTSKRARKVGKNNDLDRNGYWLWLDQLMAFDKNSFKEIEPLFDPESELTIQWGETRLGSEVLKTSYKVRAQLTQR